MQIFTLIWVIFTALDQSVSQELAENSNLISALRKVAKTAELRPSETRIADLKVAIRNRRDLSETLNQPSVLKNILFTKIKKMAEIIDKKANLYFHKFPNAGPYYGEENPNEGEPYPWANNEDRYRNSQNIFHTNPTVHSSGAGTRHSTNYGSKSVSSSSHFPSSSGHAVAYHKPQTGYSSSSSVRTIQPSGNSNFGSHYRKESEPVHSKSTHAGSSGYSKSFRSPSSVPSSGSKFSSSVSSNSGGSSFLTVSSNRSPSSIISSFLPSAPTDLYNSVAKSMKTFLSYPSSVKSSSLGKKIIPNPNSYSSPSSGNENINKKILSSSQTKFIGAKECIR